MTRTQCQINRLCGQPSLRLEDFFLVAKDGQVSPRAAKFSCCAGSGRFLDDAENSLQICELTKKLTYLQKPISLLLKLHGVSGLKSIFSKEISNRAPTGVGQFSESVKGPSEKFWAEIFATILFRQGSALVYELNQKTPLTSYWTEQTKAVFLTSELKLWDPVQNSRFEEVVSTCFNACTPLFIEQRPSFDGEVKQTRKGASVAGYVEAAKRRKNLQFLSPSCIGKLSQICLVPGTIAPTKRPPKPAKVDIRLPWDV